MAGSEQGYHRALQKVGNKNKYQYIICGLLCASFLMESFLLLGQSFYLMDPTFQCKNEPDIVDENKACPKIDDCTITNDFTIVAYMGLYCDRQNERNAIQSVLSIGSLIGLLVMNYLADLKGRKKAFILDLIIGFLGILLTIIGAYAKSTTVLILASILCGFSGYALVIICYIIASDICEEEMRQKSSLLMNLFFSFGPFLFFFLYNWCNEWYNILVLFMLIPMMGLIAIIALLLQESPNYYLFKKNDLEGCIDVLTTIAVINNKSKADIAEMRIILEEDNKASQVSEESNGDKNEIWKTLKQWKYLKIILCMGIAESGANVFFYGIQFAVNDIGFNYGIDNLVMGITEMSMVVIMTRFVTQLKRKKTMFIVYPLTVLVAFSFLFFSNQYICTFFILLIRSLTSVGYFMVMMVQTESFPIQIQSIGAGSIQSLAQLGSIASPLIVAFAINTGLNKMATMGVVLLICLIPLKFVPEPCKSGSEGELKNSLLEEDRLESSKINE